MALSESTAVFKERVLELGLGEKYQVFQATNWTSFGMFAFATTWVPGNPDDTRLREDVITPLASDPLDKAFLPCWYIEFMVALS